MIDLFICIIIKIMLGSVYLSIGFIALILLYFILLKIFDIDVLHWLDLVNPKIPFKTFESLYTINPTLWILDEDSVTYKDNYSYNSTEFESLDFSVLDLHRYHKFKKRLKKQAELKQRQIMELQNAETLERLTKAWTADIEKFVKANEQKIKLAKAENEEIISRILGNKS